MHPLKNTVYLRSLVKLAICLLLFAVAIPAFASNPVIEKVEVTQAPSPNPACAGTTVTAKIKIHLKDPDTNKELDPVPSGTVFSWKCVGVTLNGATVGSSSVSCSNGQTTTVTASFTAGGAYVINLHCDVSNPSWKDAAGNASPALTVDTSVSFSVTAPPSSINVSLTQVTATNTLAACDYGTTGIQGDLSLQITACQTQAGWQAVLTGVTAHYETQRRLLPASSTGNPGGQQEPVDYHVTSDQQDQQNATNASKTCQEIFELKNFGGCKGSTTYMLAAVNAHEDVHQKHLLTALQNSLPSIQSSISALPVVTAPDLATALTLLQNSQAFKNAAVSEHNTFGTNYDPLTASDHGTASNGPAYQAELAIVKPVYTNLCNELARATITNCPSCQ